VKSATGNKGTYDPTKKNISLMPRSSKQQITTQVVQPSQVGGAFAPNPQPGQIQQPPNPNAITAPVPEPKKKKPAIFEKSKMSPMNGLNGKTLSSFKPTPNIQASLGINQKLLANVR
jgi:hypothetical protein